MFLFRDGLLTLMNIDSLISLENKILQEVKVALQTNNRDYDLVIKKLYLYYDMKVVTFGIDDQ